MWKNSLKNAESDNNQIFYETLLYVLQRNGTYFLNNPRNSRPFVHFNQQEQNFIWEVLWAKNMSLLFVVTTARNV